MCTADGRFTLASELFVRWCFWAPATLPVFSVTVSWIVYLMRFDRRHSSLFSSEQQELSVCQ